MTTAAQRAAKEVAEKMEEVTERTTVTLRDSFPRSQIGILPKSNVKLEYVGHGAVTARLLDVDPEWTWEPVAYDANGAPLVERDANGKPVGLWIKLTVNGVTRLGYGDCLPNQMSAIKVLIGDALRNAAMRFGVALDLWVRGQGEDDEQFRGDTYSEPQPDPVEVEQMARYTSIMDRAQALKKAGASIDPLRVMATTAGFDTVNAWGKQNVDEFEEAVGLLEEEFKQRRSGEPEEADG